MNAILRRSLLRWRPERPFLLGDCPKLYATEQSGAQRRQVPEDKGKGVANKDKITLHGVEGSISITSLEDAQKLAKRRGLKLIKESDINGKSHRPVYKLITISKIKQEELLDAANLNTTKKSSTGTQSPATKGDKMLSVNNKIADHDLQSRLKHIEKWLEKQHKIIVVISGTVSDVATSENIFKRMEEVAQGKGRIIQKRTKGSEIRFQIIPIACPQEAKA